MNYDKWQNRPHTVYRLIAKLGEEFGEVMDAHGDVLDAVSPGQRDAAKLEMIEELAHLQFFAKLIAEKVAIDMQNLDDAEDLARRG